MKAASMATLPQKAKEVALSLSLSLLGLHGQSPSSRLVTDGGWAKGGWRVVVKHFAYHWRIFQVAIHH